MSNALHTLPNLVAVIRAQAEQFANRPIIRFLGDQEGDETCVTYAQVDLRARAIAAHLQASGGYGQRALVLHPPGVEYIAALLGCFYAGVVAVPAYPPRMNRSVNRLRDIASDADARFGLTSTAALARFDRQEQSASELTALQWIATDQCLPSLAENWRPHTPRSDDLALLQYTSGSTSTPKGVALSHANFLHNLRSLAQLRDAASDDHFVSWLPPYHDMGLVGATLLPLSMGTMATLLSPTTFLQRPFRWLWAITHYQGTISGGPDFAYELCCRRISEVQRASLDLRSWRVAFSGAERVRAATLSRFAATFSSCGFKPSAFAPCYGLAEATLGVSFTALDALPTSVRLDEQELGRGRACDSESELTSRLLVGCGKPVSECEVHVVDPRTRTPVPDNAIGELWVRSPSVALGYWGKPALSEEIFRARLAGSGDQDAPTYLRTGDLGFMRAGEIFVAGRIKDLIVLRGVNYYPEDIELAIESAHPRLRAGCGIAFGVDLDGEERLVVCHEVDSLRNLDCAPIIAGIRSAIAEKLQMQVYDVVLVEPGSVPKTSSGKLQRSHCRELYLSAGLVVVERSGPPSQTTPESAELTDRVAAVMATILGIDHVAPDDDFFWLGGHSLLATQLISRVREQFAVDVSLRTAFEAPTPRALAASIAAAPPLKSQGPTERADRSAPLQLSFSQERMWLLHQLDPQGAAYNVAGAGIAEGPLNVDALRAALNEVVQQHEVLRTNCLSVDGRPVLKILPSAELAIELVDLTDEEDPLATARARASIFATQPFDIAADLLVRGVVYRVAPKVHLVCVCLHHLVTDAWSMGLFLADMLGFYDEFAAGKVPPRVGPGLTYVDYAQWQREYLTDERLAPELAYWTKMLAGAEAIELPTDRPRSVRRSSAGGLQPLLLSAELLESLRTFASAEGTTLFMVMLAAFEVLLHRHTNRSDLVVGVPVANRNWLASETLMGTLVNTLAVRVELDQARSFRELLKQVRDRALDAYSHQDLPFERLISVLPIERRPGESPLVRVMFDFQNAPMPDRSVGPLTIRPLMISRQACQFDLSLLISDTDFGLLASMEYSADLFDADRIRRLLGHYVSILEFVVLHAEVLVGSVPLLSDAERSQVLAQGVRPGRAVEAESELAPGSALPGYAGWVARTPDAPAVTDWRGSLNYRDLDRAATRLANLLQAAGAGRGERVAICLGRDRNLVIAMVAALKSGTAYVPLDVRHPTDRVTLVLHDADVRVVLTDADLAQRLDVPQGVAVLCMDALDTASSGEDSPLPTDLAPQEAAYLIYTSGSTGRPKGVEVSRGALANFLNSMRRTPGMEPADRLLSVTTVAFDIAGLELLLPLVSGAGVRIAPDEVVTDGRKLSDLMAEYRPTVMQATPAGWKLLIEAGWQGDPDLRILCGGEALPGELACELLTRSRSVWNLYGPTETTIWSTIHRVTAEDGTTVPIGSPIDATRIYILDARRQLVPWGVSGEIYIGGAGVANGYFRKPELSAERFVQDPLADTAGARMYRTGDAGRWRGDGRLEYLGRLDHQIKLRGFRIEPAEIELAIKAGGRVRDALVVAREFAPGDVRLVAYCVVPAGTTNDFDLATVLSEELSRQLPSYMIPSAFVSLSAFAHTPNGKIDRAALPMPAAAAGPRAEQYVAPRDELETTLQTLWQDSLGVARVGIRDNFFVLGGHSLLATKLFAAMERELAVQLQLSVLFERSTIEYLAERIRAERNARAARTPPRTFSHLVPIHRQGTRPPLFCVHGAGGQVLNFWALAQHLGADQPFYALQAPGVDGKQTPYKDIEGMATVYLTELKTLQPHGPYYLSGYCGGGWIAFEMARRLREAGQEVALLALLDSYGPNLRRSDSRVRNWMQEALREGVGFVTSRAQGWFRRNYDSLSHAIRIGYCRLFGGIVPYDLRDVWLTRAFLSAAANFRPDTFDRKVTLVLAKDAEALAGAAESQFGWAGLTPAGLQVFHVPGTHHTLTDHPNVATLASTLARCMAAAGKSEGYQNAQDRQPVRPLTALNGT